MSRIPCNLPLSSTSVSRSIICITLQKIRKSTKKNPISDLFTYHPFAVSFHSPDSAFFDFYFRTNDKRTLSVFQVLNITEPPWLHYQLTIERVHKRRSDCFWWWIDLLCMGVEQFRNETSSRMPLVWTNTKPPTLFIGFNDLTFLTRRISEDMGIIHLCISRLFSSPSIACFLFRVDMLGSIDLAPRNSASVPPTTQIFSSSRLTVAGHLAMMFALLSA